MIKTLPHDIVLLLDRNKTHASTIQFPVNTKFQLHTFMFYVPYFHALKCQQ